MISKAIFITSSLCLSISLVHAINPSSLRNNSSLINPVTNEAVGGGVLNCDGYDDIYAQPFDDINFNNANTTDEETTFKFYEGAVDGGGVLTTFPAGSVVDKARIWVLSIEFDPAVGFVATCTEDNATPYTVTFYDNNAGNPGNVIGTSSATITSHVDTAIPFAFTSIQEVEMELDTPVAVDGAVHVSFVRQIGEGTATGNQCLALVVDEEQAGSFDDTGVTSDDTSGSDVFTPQAWDYPVCLGGTIMSDVIFANGFEQPPIN